MTIPELQLLISLVPLAYVAGAMIPIIHSDYTRNKVPNKIVVPLMVLTLLCWLTLAVWQGEWIKFGISILLSVATIVLGLFLSIKFGVLGMGDIKLIATLSMILAWFSWGIALLFLPVLVVVMAVLGLLVVLFTEVRVLKISPLVFIAFSVLLGFAF
jgi:Flp pilus assembly protein protease CpaA